MVSGDGHAAEYDARYVSTDGGCTVIRARRWRGLVATVTPIPYVLFRLLWRGASSVDLPYLIALSVLVALGAYRAIWPAVLARFDAEGVSLGKSRWTPWTLVRRFLVVEVRSLPWQRGTYVLRLDVSAPPAAGPRARRVEVSTSRFPLPVEKAVALMQRCAPRPLEYLPAETATADTGPVGRVVEGTILIILAVIGLALAVIAFGVSQSSVATNLVIGLLGLSITGACVALLALRRVDRKSDRPPSGGRGTVL
jgi:hypothetical protein